jgi:exosortase/archaeosortase family protein
LNVAEACAGLKSVMTFLMVAGTVAFLGSRALWEKLVITVSAIPIAIFCNVMRVSGQGLLDRYVSREWSEGFAHQFAGLVMLIPGFFLIMAVGWVLERMFIEEVDKNELAISAAAKAGRSKRVIVEVPRKQEGTLLASGAAAAGPVALEMMAVAEPGVPAVSKAVAAPVVSKPAAAPVAPVAPAVANRPKPVASAAAAPANTPKPAAVTNPPAVAKPAVPRTPLAAGAPAASTLKPSTLKPSPAKERAANGATPIAPVPASTLKPSSKPPAVTPRSVAPAQVAPSAPKQSTLKPSAPKPPALKPRTASEVPQQAPGAARPPQTARPAARAVPASSSANNVKQEGTGGA